MWLFTCPLKFGEVAALSKVAIVRRSGPAAQLTPHLFRFVQCSAHSMRCPTSERRQFLTSLAIFTTLTSVSKTRRRAEGDELSVNDQVIDPKRTAKGGGCNHAPCR